MLFFKRNQTSPQDSAKESSAPQESVARALPSSAPSGSQPVSSHASRRARSLVLAPSPQKVIWAIGGGKGGIGKTIVTSNLALFISWLNKKVVVVDMDLGGANLHTSLGVVNPTKTLSDLLYHRIEDANAILQPTHYRNLFLISGAQDPMGIANMPNVQKTRLGRKLREIDADFILLDLGAGTSQNTIDFFLLADKKIVVVTPEPTSIENAYRFIKTAFYRMLRASTQTPYVRQLIEQAMDQSSSRGITSPKELLNEVVRLSPVDGEILKSKMEAFSFSLIVNQVRATPEAQIGKSIQLVCQRYFGIEIDYPGFIPYDNAIWQAIRKKVPFLVDAPNSTAVTQLEAVLRNLLKNPSQG